jgi:hypothetical protein
MEDNKHAGQLYQFFRLVLWKWEIWKEEYSLLISSNDATEKVWIHLTGLNDIFTSCDAACLLLIHANLWNQLGQDLSLSEIFMQISDSSSGCCPVDPLLTVGSLDGLWAPLYELLCSWISNSWLLCFSLDHPQGLKSLFKYFKKFKIARMKHFYVYKQIQAFCMFLKLCSCVEV